MVKTTDKDMAHFLSEHYELLKWVFKLCNLLSRKTVEFYRDEKSAYAHTVSQLNDKNLYGNVEGTKQALKSSLMTMEISGGPVDVKDTWDDESNFKHGFNTGCPFMNHRRD